MNGDDAAGDLNRVERMLGTPETAWLLARSRDRLERTGSLTGTVTKQSATSAERTAAARLVGRAVRAGMSASVSLDDLDDLLRRSGAWPGGLASAVIALTGPVSDPVARNAERDDWRAANDTLISLGARVTELDEWARRAVQTGALRRAVQSASHAREYAESLARIADALPVDGESLGIFSARVMGDAHALDRQTPLGSLATGLAAQLGNRVLPADWSTASGSDDADEETPDGVRLGSARPGSAQWRRDAWQSVGVIVDELSSTVLTLGLVGGSGSPTARSLASLAAVGQPTVLTLRQLIADGVGAAPAVLRVCENPAVVAAAADRLGPRSGAIVCLNGQPGAAALALLRSLAAAGSAIRYHGDFDAGGTAIARTLARHVRWHPWRFTADDYELAVIGATGLGTFTGSVGDTPWDPPLAGVMTRLGVRVEEELVIEPLLADLG